MDVFYSDYSTGCKNIWIRLLCIKMTVFGNRFNKRFLIDVLSSWLTAVHSYCCIKRFLETLFNSFFRNCLVHVVTYHNITHKDKLKAQLRIISIRISVSKGYWLKTDQLFSTSKTYKLSFWLKYREQTLSVLSYGLSSLHAKTEKLLATETSWSCNTSSWLAPCFYGWYTTTYTIFRINVRMNYRCI